MSISLRLLRATVPLGLLAALAACADHASPLAAGGSEDAPGPAPLQSLSCTADVRAGVVSCDSGPGPSGGPSRLIVDGQGVFVRLASSNPAYAGGVFTFDATVQNLIRQTLGVGADGEPDGNGVSVVFWQEPVATEGTGDITINDALTGMFLQAGDRYYRYDQTLARDQTSAPRRWSFNVPATVTRFGFSVYVAATVQYPDG